MNNQQDNLPELIDCCRPQADDLQLPELQPLAAAIQTDPQVDRRLKKSHRIDALIGQSIRDVSIPARLEERLLAALSSSQPYSESTDAATSINLASPINLANEISPADDGLVGVEVVPIAPRGVVRNHWRVWLSVAASLAAIAVIALFVIRNSEPRLASADDIAKQSQQWLAVLNGAAWGRPPFPDKSFPLPSLRLRPYRWQQLAGTRSSLEAVCYDISLAKHPTTHLFVCRSPGSAALPKAPPKVPSKVASGWLVGGWQADGFVYVLAVHGNGPQYLELISPNQRLASTARLQVRS